MASSDLLGYPQQHRSNLCCNRVSFLVVVFGPSRWRISLTWIVNHRTVCHVCTSCLHIDVPHRRAFYEYEQALLLAFKLHTRCAGQCPDRNDRHVRIGTPTKTWLKHSGPVPRGSLTSTSHVPSNTPKLRSRRCDGPLTLSAECSLRTHADWTAVRTRSSTLCKCTSPKRTGSANLNWARYIGTLDNARR